MENTKRMLKDKWERNSKVLKLEEVKEERQGHMEICAATHLRLGPITRPIAHRIFLFRNVETRPTELTILAKLGTWRWRREAL